jgi:hypothetical protein
MRRRDIAARQGKLLTLHTQGPGFTGDGEKARQQDVIMVRNQRKRERPPTLADAAAERGTGNAS